MTQRPHVLVIGGGPGGATASAILAREGARVTLIERETFPREHVGESMQPASIALLETHLGLRSEIEAAAFPRKYGATYVWGETRTPWSVLFDDQLEHALPTIDASPDPEGALLNGSYDHAYNVDLVRFDDILFRAALRAGVELRHTEARAPIVENGRVVGVTTRDAAGHEERVRGDYVVDASGQRCLLGRAFDLAEDVEDMRATATYGYLDGAGGAPGALGRHVQMVESVSDGWCWFIPIARDRTSVGVVSQGRERLTDERFDSLLAETSLPLGGGRWARDTKGQRLRRTRDWSYACKRFAGEGYALVGDSACFVDPILSGGVDFAIRMGCRVAFALVRGLGGAEPLDPLIASCGDQLRREYKAYLRIARYWYGNNRSVAGLFWEAHKEIGADALSTPLRAFVYLTTGKHAADQHLKVFTEWQEKKMFGQLGVDEPELKKAWRGTRPRSA
jgi:halogenation protein CepH